MATRDKQKLSTYNLLGREVSPPNPMSPVTGGRRVQNFIPHKTGTLERKTASHLFISSDPAIVASAVRRIIDFRYQDQYGGDHQEVLWVKADGRIYRKQRGGEIETYPRFFLRPLTATIVGQSPTNPFNANDDKIDTNARFQRTSPLFDEMRYDSFAEVPSRTIADLTLVMRSQVISTAGNGVARLRYSLDNGTSFTNVYDLAGGTARALQDDSVTLTSTQTIADIQVEVRQNETSTTYQQDIYDIRLEATWSGARVLDNPRDVAWVVANNRLYISDGDQVLVYLGQKNGGGWFIWGMPRPIAPTVNIHGNSNFSLTTGRKYAVSWVHIENSIRIHESSRSDRVEGGAITDQIYRIHRPPSPPERATHWTIYASAIDGAVDLVRLETVPIATLFHDDISPDFGETGSTMSSVREPIRNDPPPKSQVLTLHKNRIFARNEENKNELWHSALGEVLGESNGSPWDSFPGFGLDTISDIQNFIDVPDQTDEITAFISWLDQLWFFTRRQGFRLEGQGGLMDNFPLRDFDPKTAFQVGCSGPEAITTCPFGLAWVTPERKVVLFAGGGFFTDSTAALLDIGADKQLLFDQIDDTELRRSQLLYHRGLNALAFKFTTFDGTNRLYLYSFELRDQASQQLGGWVEIADLDPTAIGLMFDTNKEFLLVGEADGEIRVLEQVVGNTVIGKSQALIGKLVLGASSNIANYPAATLRTSNSNLGFDGVKVADYVVVTPHRQAVSDHTVNTTTPQAAPTVAFWDDVADPENPGSSTSVTLSSVTKTRNFRGAIGSAGGTMLDRLMMEVSFASGSPEGTADGDDFLQTFTSRINGLGVIFSPEEEKYSSE